MKAEMKTTQKSYFGAPKCFEPVIMIYSHFRVIPLAKSENLSIKPSNCLDQSHNSVMLIKHPFDPASCPPWPIRTPNHNPKKGSDCNESVFVWCVLWASTSNGIINVQVVKSQFVILQVLNYLSILVIYYFIYNSFKISE